MEKQVLEGNVEMQEVVGGAVAGTPCEGTHSQEGLDGAVGP